MANRKRQGNTKKKDTRAAAQALENAIGIVRGRGFYMLDGRKNEKQHFLKTHKLPRRYIERPYATPTLYGTRGSKEAFIHCPKAGDFIFEAKYQGGSGSVDEKLQYIWEHFLVSPVRNWIVLFAGKYFMETIRGQRSVQWLKDRVASHPSNERTMYVAHGDQEFWDLIERLFEYEERESPTPKQKEIFPCTD